jgi:hypothetical protein
MATTDDTRPGFTDARTVVDLGTEKVFRTSILVSAVRCTLAYVVFPFAAPLLGLAAGIEGTIGLVIGLVAIVFNVYSIRRFWATGYRLKVPLTVLNVGMIGLVTWFIWEDVVKILG